MQAIMCAVSTSSASRPWYAGRMAVVLALVLPSAALGRASTPGPNLPEPVRTRHRGFSIPFRVPKPSDPDADAATERVVLQVSTDLGTSWQSAGETGPASTSFTYTAKVDGEYWFRLRAVDRKGRMRGGEGPDVRVLVDAAGPRLAARVWKGADGEIVCRYAAVDDTLRLETVKVEYQTSGEKGWKTVATQPILSRESPAHLVGEEIWWAGEKVDALTARISVADASGNETVRQFTMSTSDPQVDQAALAVELGVPPLPTAESGTQSPAVTSVVVAPTTPGDAAVGTASNAEAGSGRAGWSAEPGHWSAGQPRPDGSAVAVAGRSRSVLVKRAAGAASGMLPQAAPPDVGSQIAALPRQTSAPGTAGHPLEYRGKPLHIARSRRFAWDYEAHAPQNGVGKLRAELWSTQDGGLTWQRIAVDEDGVSPIDLHFPNAGLYGVRLEMAADVPEAASGPRSGEAPEAWLGVDEEPPQAEILGAARDEASGGIVIRYAARDPLLVPSRTRLLYSPNVEGPWATIADGLDNQGEHRWQPERGVPARVFVRVEATDAAGNVGTATTPEPVLVAASRTVGKLGGLRLPPPSPPQ